VTYIGCSSSFLRVYTTLLFLENFREGEGFVGSSGTLVELAHELDPMETHRMEEHFQGVHHEEDAEDGEHVAESNDEEVKDCNGAAHLFKVGTCLSEEDLQEHLSELSVSQ